MLGAMILFWLFSAILLILTILDHVTNALAFRAYEKHWGTKKAIEKDNSSPHRFCYEKFGFGKGLLIASCLEFLLFFITIIAAWQFIATSFSLDAQSSSQLLAFLSGFAIGALLVSVIENLYQYLVENRAYLKIRDSAKKAALYFIASIFVFMAFLFIPAGRLDFWQAWAYLATILIPALLIVSYFIIKDPEFLARRLKYKEKVAEQKSIQKFGAIIFIIGFILPGLDQRFGLTSVPAELSVAACAVVLLSYIFIFLVFRENHYAGRTIEVVRGQKVISSGPYSIIRHPMYLGMLFFLLATPIALGSYAALIPFLLTPAMLYLRILNEEKVLLKELAGYANYKKKVKYRLIPLVW